jgi:hypothetical protein
MLSCIVKHSVAVDPDKWHRRYAASRSNLHMKIFDVGCLNQRFTMKCRDLINTKLYMHGGSLSLITLILTELPDGPGKL